jgi:tetratricopeptide (TPR) repeat protein
MQHYGVRDVEKLLGLPRSTIRALVDAGFVTPQRGPRNAWLFTFQDLIVLRTAQALAAAKLSQRRIARSLRELRRHLPAAMPLSGLRIGAVGDAIVVREGGQQWQADSGQYLLAFEGDPSEGALKVAEPATGSVVVLRRPAPPQSSSSPLDVSANDDDIAPLPRTRERKSKGPKSPQPQKAKSRARSETGSGNADFWFDRAVAQEGDDINAAVHAYERAIAADPAHLEAHVNFGRLLHEAGRLAQAERVYRAAIRNCGDDATLLFNLGVLLEDLQRPDDAADAYEAAVAADPLLADGHYNLALLYEGLRRPREALRHMAQYRRLVTKK